MHHVHTDAENQRALCVCVCVSKGSSGNTTGATEQSADIFPPPGLLSWATKSVARTLYG